MLRDVVGLFLRFQSNTLCFCCKSNLLLSLKFGYALDKTPHNAIRDDGSTVGGVLEPVHIPPPKRIRLSATSDSTPLIKLCFDEVLQGTNNRNWQQNMVLSTGLNIVVTK